jgi:predicted nucleotidyltransferase
MKQEIEELLGRRVDLVRLRAHMNASLREHILRDAKYV